MKRANFIAMLSHERKPLRKNSWFSVPSTHELYYRWKRRTAKCSLTSVQHNQML
jgi:hypothetical protein